MEAEQKYPLNRGELTESDFRCLAKALGFQARVFLSACDGGSKRTGGSPRSGGGGMTERGGVLEEHFIQLLDSGAFNRLLHKTFNTRDADYNVKLTKCALTLLMRRMCSFQEIRQVGRSVLVVRDYWCESSSSPRHHTLLHHCTVTMYGQYLKCALVWEG